MGGVGWRSNGRLTGWSLARPAGCDGTLGLVHPDRNGFHTIPTCLRDRWQDGHSVRPMRRGSSSNSRMEERHTSTPCDRTVRTSRRSLNTPGVDEENPAWGPRPDNNRARRWAGIRSLDNVTPVLSIHPNDLTCGVRVLIVFPSPPLPKCTSNSGVPGAGNGRPRGRPQSGLNDRLPHKSFGVYSPAPDKSFDRPPEDGTSLRPPSSRRRGRSSTMCPRRTTDGAICPPALLLCTTPRPSCRRRARTPTCAPRASRR